MIISSIVSMIVAQKLDGYSIKHDRLSYTGIRQDFTHPVRGTFYKKNTYPEILNYGLVLASIIHILAFLQIESTKILVVGVMFSTITGIIGGIDVSTNYNLHNRSVIASQPAFLVLIYFVLQENYNIQTIYVLGIIIILVVINVYQKQTQNRNPSKIANVVPQKLFIYIEAIYLVFLTYLID